MFGGGKGPGDASEDAPHHWETCCSAWLGLREQTKLSKTRVGLAGVGAVEICGKRMT